MSTEKIERAWSLKNRLLALLSIQVEEKGRYKTLEKLTEIKATHWRDFAAGKQRPTAEMIEAASKLWPQHAFWLATGISDAEHGHVAPGNEDFPFKSPKSEGTAALFLKSLELLDASIDVLNDDLDFRNEEIQFHLLMTGTQRILNQMDIGILPARKEQLNKLWREVGELQKARKLENEIKQQSPDETRDESEKALPKRLLKLSRTKVLSDLTVKELEAILESERLSLEQSKKADEFLRMLKNGDK